jgi:NSS family neurotransmitter:Na+ symporter
VSNSRPPRLQWASRLGFILAAAGSAIGLGNIWKFPYITGKNGGGAFVLAYLVCIALVGLPIMMAEFLIGRHGQKDAVGSFAALEGRRSPWCLVGWGGVAASFILLSFYAVVAGWSFDYIVKAATGSFADRSAAEINALFGALVSSPLRVIFWQILFMLATVAIVIGGIRGGIERWSKVLMPLLFLLLVLLFIRGMLSPGARAGLEFMFRPDFASLTPGALLDALGHAFFTLSLGAGTMITYGSYLERKSDLLALSLRIVLLDTLVALLAGLAIFSVVFAAGLEAGAGPGLVFQTIPIVFSTLPFGSLLATLFFVLLAFAALSSSISMLEVSVAYLIDEKGWTRWRATTIVGCAALLLGIPSALSFNLWGEVKPLFGRTFFDLFDTLVSSYMLPLGGLFVAVYAGWFWKGAEEKSELVGRADLPWLFPVWQFLLRYVAPAAVLIILVNQAGLFG